MRYMQEISENSAATDQEPQVAILLATFNGERYIQEQLDSIARQTHRHWTLHVSDDGSTDATPDILARFQKQHGTEKVFLHNGPRNGFAQNFFSLVRNPNIQADFFAFCDQDDIWFEDKLAKAVAQLKRHKQAATYCSRTRLINQHGSPIGYSPHFKRAPSFRNALVQSLAGANTMLLNTQARALLARTPLNAPIVSHDWLCYLLVSGSGGKVIYDPEPSLYYRQHDDNLIGSNSTWGDRLVRAKRMLKGTFQQWNRENIITLRYCEDELTKRNRQTLALFERSRQTNLPKRLCLLLKSGVYRQTNLGTAILILAACIGKL